MPAEIFWYQEKRIIYHRYSGEIQVAEVNAASQESLALTLEGLPPVYILVDLSEVTNFPKSINTYRAALKPVRDPDCIGWVIIFGAKNTLLKFIASALAHIAGARSNVRVVDTLKQAMTFLEGQDSFLIDLERYQMHTE